MSKSRSNKNRKFSYDMDDEYDEYYEDDGYDADNYYIRNRNDGYPEYYDGDYNDYQEYYGGVGSSKPQSTPPPENPQISKNNRPQKTNNIIPNTQNLNKPVSNQQIKRTKANNNTNNVQLDHSMNENSVTIQNRNSRNEEDGFSLITLKYPHKKNIDRTPIKTRNTIPTTPIHLTEPTQSNPSTPREMLYESAALTDEERKISKPIISILVTGHIDHGKSTLLGQLIFLSKNIDNKTIRKFQKQSSEIGKSSFYLAWVLDCNEQERSSGQTLDLSYINIETEKYKILFIDSPGHKDLINFMIFGANMCDKSMVVVSVLPGEFEAGISDNGQTKEDFYLLRSYGVSDIIVAINKLDSINYDQERYSYVYEEVQKLTQSCGFKSIQIVPLSGISGENIIKIQSNQFSWYKGPSLFDSINNFTPPQTNLDYPLRFCVLNIESSNIFGKIASGYIRVNDIIRVIPGNYIGTVKSITEHGISVDHSLANTVVTLNIDGINDTLIKPGQVICHPTKPIPTTNKFKAKIQAFPVLKTPLIMGRDFILHTLTNDIQSHIESIDSLESNGKPVKGIIITKNMVGDVVIKTDSIIPLETFSDLHLYGRFVIRLNGQTCAAGKVLKIS